MAAPSPHTEANEPALPPDERLWPIQLALGVWAALLAAVAWSLGGFNDPRLLENGWVRLITIGATAAALGWATRTFNPQRARRLKFAVVISLIGHTLLLILLYEQQMQYRGMPLDQQELLATQPPPEGQPRTENFPLDSLSDSSKSDELEQPITTALPKPQTAVLPRRADLPDFDINHKSPQQAAAARPELTPRHALLRRRQDALARAAPMPRKLNHREPLEATIDATASLASLPPVIVDRQVPNSAQLKPAASVSAVRRAAAPALLPPSVVMMPKLPAAVQLPDLPRQRPGELAATAALNAFRARSRRHIKAATLPANPADEASSASRRPAAAYAARGELRIARPSRDAAQTTTETEAAVERGLDFLARIQLDDGHWEFQYLGEQADPQETERIVIEADAAATGLALLALLGAGYDHMGDRYEHVVRDGLHYLTSIQSPSGELYLAGSRPAGQVARFYGHGIATLALCEAYGMTGDPALQPPAQLAVDYLVSSQHPELGGWRYVPGLNADLSVSGWQLMALKGGELAGLGVPSETYTRLRTLLEQCREEDGQQARFRYNPWASPSDPRTRHGRRPSTVMTAVGMLMQLRLDGAAIDERLQAGGNHLLANLPQFGDAPNTVPTGTLGNPQRDAYYWFYATQVVHLLGGEYWNAWHERLLPLLVNSQTTAGPMAGSWDPLLPVPDKWANYGGRLYVTTLNLLSLEVHHRNLRL